MNFVYGKVMQMHIGSIKQDVSKQGNTLKATFYQLHLWLPKSSNLKGRSESTKRRRVIMNVNIEEVVFDRVDEIRTLRTGKLFSNLALPKPQSAKFSINSSSICPIISQGA